MSGPGLIIKGAIIGCILVLLFTLFATANVASAGIVTDDEMGVPVSHKTPVDPQKKVLNLSTINRVKTSRQRLLRINGPRTTPNAR